jgi:hypothetical protein
MRWLKDKDSVSKEELAENKYGVWVDDVETIVYTAAYYAYWVNADDAAYWVDEYFKRTGESRNEYLKELNK